MAVTALTVWWVDFDGDPEEPELYATLEVAKADAVSVYRKANDVGVWGDDPEPAFDWRGQRGGGGGVQLYVDAEATGIVVRELPVKDGTEATS